MRVKFEKKEKYMAYDRLKSYLQDLEVGEFFLHSARKVRNNLYPDQYKIQLAGWERVLNPKKDETLLKKLNEGDPRFTAKPQPGWIVAEPNVIVELFDIPMKDLDKLELFSGAEFPMAAQTRGKHFHWLGLVSPRIDGVEMHVQISEFVSDTPVPRKDPKIIPTTGQIITCNGLPVYRNTSIILGKAQNVFLESDGVGASTGMRVSFGEYAPDTVEADAELVS
jgi:hypothetical protein